MSTCIRPLPKRPLALAALAVLLPAWGAASAEPRRAGEGAQVAQPGAAHPQHSRSQQPGHASDEDLRRLEAAAARHADAGNYREALAQLRKAAALAQAGGQPAAHARALAWEARVQVDRGDYAAGRELLERLAQVGAVAPEARALAHLARGMMLERMESRGLARDAGYDGALREYTAARALVERHALPLGAVAHFRVAVVTERRGADAAAEALYASVERRARRVRDDATLAFVQLHRANIASRAGRLEAARAGHARARDSASRAGLLFIEAVARLHLTDAMEGPEAAQEALRVAQQLEPLAQQLPGLLDTALLGALETAAEHLRPQDAAGARALLQRALARARRSGLPRDSARLAAELQDAGADVP